MPRQESGEQETPAAESGSKERKPSFAEAAVTKGMAGPVAGSPLVWMALAREAERQRRASEAQAEESTRAPAKSVTAPEDEAGEAPKLTPSMTSS